MRIAGKCVLSVVVAGLLVIPAAAQKVEIKVAPGFAAGAPYGFKLNILQSEDVQKDLKLSDEQVAKIKDLGEKQKNAFKDLPMDKEARLKKFQEIQKENQEREKAAADLLKPEQSKRLDQIMLQQQGIGALMNPKTAEELKITDEQKAKIKEVVQESSKEMRDLFQGGKIDPEEAQKKIAENRTKTMEKATAVLTPEQQKQWKEKVGEPFKGKLGFGAWGPIRIQPKPDGAKPAPGKKIEFKVNPANVDK